MPAATRSPNLSPQLWKYEPAATHSDCVPDVKVTVNTVESHRCLQDGPHIQGEPNIQEHRPCIESKPAGLQPASAGQVLQHIDIPALEDGQ